MPRVLVLVLLALCLEATAASSSPGGPVAGPPAPAASPVASVVVTVAGDSVADVFARHAGTDLPVSEVAVRARKLADVLRAADREVARRQRPVIAGIAAAGAKVVSQYRAAASGLLVHGTSDQIEAIRALPGVARVEPAPRLRPDLARSVPRIGAEAVAARDGFTGTGTTIAIVDSGIDYTHAAVGGPGDPDAYTAAAAAAERIDDPWQGERLFPNDVVVGGWDFVGPNYTHPELCPPQAEAAGRCTGTPHPDPDPIDQHGHGTHVAGIAAGRQTADVYHGVAPGARLVALKVYGPPERISDTDETIDVLIDAIDWCVAVNLGLDVPGIPPPAPGLINVINLSLGEPYAQGSRLVDEAFAAAMTAGMVVVAAEGNDGDTPYIASAPGASPNALAVAAIVLGDSGAGGDDVMAGYSARGPSKNGSLKPDLAAPGGVVSARVGSGVGGAGFSGTSGATPHVAGAAALLFERDRARSLRLSAREIAALLMNSADPMPGVGSAVPVVRQGAGRLDVSRAACQTAVAGAGDIASLNLGAIAVSAPVTLTRTIRVRNLVDAELSLRADMRFLHPEDAAAGVTVTVPAASIVIPARGAADVPVAFGIDPASLRPWTLRGTAPFAEAAVDALEVDGYVTLTPDPGAGTSDPSDWAIRIPFYVLPRPASAVTVVDQPDVTKVTLTNVGVADDTALFFVVPDGLAPGDPDEPGVVGELDVRRVGVRFDDDGSTLTFGVVLHDVAVLPHLTQFELYVDVDRDGVVDYRVRAGAVRSGATTMTVGVAPWDEAAGAPSGDEREVGRATYDLHTRLVFVSVPLSVLGLPEPAAFDFYLVHRALGEDWWKSDPIDVVPDGAFAPCGRTRLTVEPSTWRNLPERWSVAVPAGATVDVARSGGTGTRTRTPALLVAFPGNRFDEVGRQDVLVTRGADPDPMTEEAQCRVDFPIVLRSHRVLKLAPPDEMTAAAFAATAAAHWAKMTWDVTDAHDPSQDGQRDYQFRNPDGFFLARVPRGSQYMWQYIRVGNEGFEHKLRFGVTVEPWHCYAVDEHMLFWPEWMTRLRTEFPTDGWRLEGESDYYGNRTWLLRHGASDAPVRHLARIDVTTGVFLFLSRRASEGGVDVRADNYAFRDYGVVNIGMSRPNRLQCPPGRSAALTLASSASP